MPKTKDELLKTTVKDKNKAKRQTTNDKKTKD